MALAAGANEPQCGYRGFAEWDNNITSYNYYFGGSETVWYTGVSTSHGYQFNPHIFAGAGLMLERSTKYDQWTVPVFAQFRTDLSFGKYTPFGDIRLGYNFTDGGGIYFSPTVGYRFNFGRKLNLNLGVGMTLRGYTLDCYDLKGYDYETGHYVEAVYMGKSHQSKAMFNIRVGIDF